MSRRCWEVARRYLVWPLVLGLLLLAGGRRRAGLASLGAAGVVLFFFRDPERRIEPAPDVVYSAADGVVKEVGETVEPRMPGGRAVRISTFLSLHNVHVNRSPVAGRVVEIERVGGGFAPALFVSAEGNYRHRIPLDGERGPVIVVQKAGAIARRITDWVEPGERVKAGQRIGLIHFGSRADVLLPAEEVEVLVRTGDRIRAGLTPIARYRSRH